MKLKFAEMKEKLIQKLGRDAKSIKGGATGHTCVSVKLPIITMSEVKNVRFQIDFILAPCIVIWLT